MRVFVRGMFGMFASHTVYLNCLKLRCPYSGAVSITTSTSVIWVFNLSSAVSPQAPLPRSGFVLVYDRDMIGCTFR